jgi:N-acyl-D-aspartate/D-glutamate deacylase
MFDLLLRHGRVVDGTGGAPFVADIAISDRRIVSVGRITDSDARKSVDVSGRLVCPGFIDVHSHSDLTLLSNPLAHSKVHQGVTTELVGNCGLGVTGLPISADVSGVRDAVNYLDVDPGVEWSWSDQDSYFSALESAGPSVNVATLVGHVPLRAGEVGFENREATAAELAAMKERLTRCLDAGAFGLSTGLAYAPACFATRDELTELARVVAGRDKLFAWHLSDYGDQLMQAASQAIEIGRQTGCRTQISHLVSVGRRNWGTVTGVLELVDQANAHGADVAADVYPYTAGNTMLSQLLPPWAREGAEADVCRRLEDEGVRLRILDGWADRSTAWSELVISAAPGEEQLVGASVETIASSRRVDGGVAALDLLHQLGNSVIVTAFGRCDDDVRSVYQHARTLVGSDGLALDPDGPTGRGAPHPRSYGCYPRLFAKYVSPDLPVERIVEMSTGAVARRLGIDDRGVLAEGKLADVVVIDPEKVKDKATYTDPHRYPDGIDLVIVNGCVVIEGGAHTGSRCGRVLRSVL